MDLLNELHELAAKIELRRGHVESEEGTKQAFVIPFIKLLGYDVEDPSEVVPEYKVDSVGIKSGEKVDYAILRGGKPIILIECKPCNDRLNDNHHKTQLYRYFSVTEARLAVLTNGIVYRFFSDLEKTNQMDSGPFLELNLLDIEESLLDELGKITKPSFNLDGLLSTARDLKDTREIKLFLNRQLDDPSQDFVRFLASQFYPGLKAQQATAELVPITKHALRQFVDDHNRKHPERTLEEETSRHSQRPPRQPSLLRTDL